MMDDIAEQNDVANEISQAISTGIIGTNVDEDDLLKELGELEQEELDKELLNVGPSPSKLPDVPADALPSASKTKGIFLWFPRKSWNLYILFYLFLAKAKVEEDEDPDMKELMQWAN